MNIPLLGVEKREGRSKRRVDVVGPWESTPAQPGFQSEQERRLGRKGWGIWKWKVPFSICPLAWVECWEAIKPQSRAAGGMYLGRSDWENLRKVPRFQQICKNKKVCPAPDRSVKRMQTLNHVTESPEGQYGARGGVEWSPWTDKKLTRNLQVYKNRREEKPCDLHGLVYYPDGIMGVHRFWGRASNGRGLNSPSAPPCLSLPSFLASHQIIFPFPRIFTIISWPFLSSLG